MGGALEESMDDPRGDMPLGLLVEYYQSALGPALPAVSEMASLCPSKPDLVTLDLESSKPFSAGEMICLDACIREHD